MLYEVITQGVVAGVLFCMLFSYPLENYVIPFIILMVLAYYASGIPHTVWEWHITPRTRLFAGITISLISLLAAILGGIGLYYALRWKGVYERFQAGDKSAVKDYAELVSVLRYDKYFCFNYGTALYRITSYNVCYTKLLRWNRLFIGLSRVP